MKTKTTKKATELTVGDVLYAYGACGEGRPFIKYGTNLEGAMKAAINKKQSWLRGACERIGYTPVSNKKKPTSQQLVKLGFDKNNADYIVRNFVSNSMPLTKADAPGFAKALRAYAAKTVGSLAG